MTDASIFSALIQAGSAGLVIMVVVLFLNFLREERKARAEEIQKRDEEYTKRNEKLCLALDGLTRQVSLNTERLIEHDVKVDGRIQESQTAVMNHISASKEPISRRREVK